MNKKILIAGLFTSVMLLVPVNSAYSNIGIQIQNNPVIQSNRGNTIYVGGSGPNNYSKIQDAIDDSSDDDTVFVYDDSSPYREDLDIDKRITLIGEDKNTTVIRGHSYQAVIDINHRYITVTGFTVQSSFLNLLASGIEARPDNCNIYGNIIKNSYIGIFLGGNDCNIHNNIIINNRVGIDISRAYSEASYNNIYHNFFMNNDICIRMGGPNFMYGSHYNKIYQNNFSNSFRGIFIPVYGPAAKNDIYHNNFIKNSRNAEDWGYNNWNTSTEGNYWDSYKGEDNNGDGIGDTPYILAPYIMYLLFGSGNEDKHPLMKPYENVTNFDITNTNYLHYSNPFLNRLLDIWRYHKL